MFADAMTSQYSANVFDDTSEFNPDVSDDTREMKDTFRGVAICPSQSSDQNNAKISKFSQDFENYLNFFAKAS